MFLPYHHRTANDALAHLLSTSGQQKPSIANEIMDPPSKSLLRSLAKISRTELNKITSQHKVLLRPAPELLSLIVSIRLIEQWLEQETITLSFAKQWICGISVLEVYRLARSLFYPTIGNIVALDVISCALNAWTELPPSSSE